LIIVAEEQLLLQEKALCGRENLYRTGNKPENEPGVRQMMKVTPTDS
jgi:hypothetical protein